MDASNISAAAVSSNLEYARTAVLLETDLPTLNQTEVEAFLKGVSYARSLMVEGTSAYLPFAVKDIAEGDGWSAEAQEAFNRIDAVLTHSKAVTRRLDELAEAVSEVENETEAGEDLNPERIELVVMVNAMFHHLGEMIPAAT
jgi:hypothetical protein